MLRRNLKKPVTKIYFLKEYDYVSCSKVEQRLWYIEYFIEIGEHHSQRHSIGNYSYVTELLICCALFDTSSGLIEDVESLLNPLDIDFRDF